MAAPRATNPRLTTLGATTLALGGNAVNLQPLPLMLLAYLAIEGPKPRRHLAELFWPRSNNGLNSLSSSLSRIRRSCPTIVDANPTTVAVAVGTDLDELRQAIAARNVGRVLDVCGGAFLGDLALRSVGPELEEWLLDQQDRIVSEVERALLEGAELAVRENRTDDATELVVRLYEIVTRDAIPTPALLPRYHRVLTAIDHPIAGAVEADASEYGIDLTTERPDRQTTIGIPLFGFERERRWLHTVVAREPISQVVGLGGSGKTRLATEFFDSVEVAANFAHRVWVDLSAVRRADVVGSAVAAAFGATLRPGDSLADAVNVAAPTLVVLDNFEQVADAIPTVQNLLEASPQLRIVVTSRIPVLSGSDATLALPGLPTDEAHGPAQRLFHAAAQRAGATVDTADTEAITEICSLVGGLPLAIELAGAWTRVLPARNIAASLRSSTELLKAPPGSAQRAVDDIVADSISALDPADQYTLRTLAEFPAGLDTSHAAATLATDMASVARLADRSLLVADRNAGRLSLHPLIAHKIRTTDRGSDRASDERPLLEWCRAHQCELSTLTSVELANISTAWRQASQIGAWDVIDRGLSVVREFFVQSGRMVEGQHLFAEVLPPARREAARDLVLRLLEADGWIAYAAGQTGRARRLLSEAHAIIDAAASDEELLDDESLALVHRLDGTVAVVEGSVVEATAAFQRALDLTSRTTATGFTARLAIDLGRCHELSGDIEAAREQYRSARDLGRSGDDPQIVTLAYFFLASLEQVASPKRCLVLLDEGRHVADEHGLDHLATYFPILGGHAYLNMGDANLAEQQFREGLAKSEAVGLRLSVAANSVGIAESLVASDPDRAIDAARDGIRVSIETRCMPYLAWAAFVVADLLLRQGSDDPSLAGLLAQARGHPALAGGLLGRAEAVMRRHGVEACSASDSASLGDVDDLGLRLLELLRFA